MSQNKVELRAGRDVHVNHEKPSGNWQNSIRLDIRSDATNKGRFAYIYFPVSLPKNVTITSATLTLFMDTNTEGDGSRTLSVKRVAEGWSASKTTWENRPTVVGAAASVTKNGKPRFERWDFNVTTHVQQIVNGAEWYGWRIESDEDVLRELNSSEADSRKPLLTIEWAEQPSKPSDLNPRGGGFVASAAPTLSWDFRDNRGNTNMGGFEVQVAEDAAMTVFIHQSGIKDSNVPIYDLATVAGLEPLTATTPYYWRVRVKDAANNWSDWSDVTSFKYDSKGTLAIVSPSGNTISDPSPTIVWSLTGKTQAAWQVLVRNANGKELYDSGKFTSLDNSWEIPAEANGVSIIDKKDHNYDIVVRVWDDVDRSATIGNDVMYEAIKTVSYTPASSGSGSTGGAATAPSTPVAFDMAAVGEPGIRLTWTLAEAPDRFHVWRGSRKLETLTPGDAMTGTPGEWTYTDYTAKTGVTYDYRVAASVNGNSAESSIVNITKSLKGFSGIWLMDSRRGIKVQIFGNDEGSWEMGEESQTYTPIGGTRTRLVTQALRGYEGSITGMLTGTESRTITQQEEDMFTLKQTPGQTYALVVANMAIPVVISNVVVRPTPHKEAIRMVSFNFYQQGNLPFEASL